MASRSLLHHFPAIKRGIDDAKVAHNRDPTPWLWAMPPAELGLVAFAVVVFAIPSDASAAALAVLYVSLSSSFRQVRCC